MMNVSPQNSCILPLNLKQLISTYTYFSIGSEELDKKFARQADIPVLPVTFNQNTINTLNLENQKKIRFEDSGTKF